jgi:hypothetical protein
MVISDLPEMVRRLQAGHTPNYVVDLTIQFERADIFRIVNEFKLLGVDARGILHDGQPYINLLGLTDKHDVLPVQLPLDFDDGGQSQSLTQPSPPPEFD